jgi:hypothetical protein
MFPKPRFEPLVIEDNIAFYLLKDGAINKNRYGILIADHSFELTLSNGNF